MLLEGFGLYTVGDAWTYGEDTSGSSVGGEKEGRLWLRILREPMKALCRGPERKWARKCFIDRRKFTPATIS